MSEIPPPKVATQLIVFADDWGRHPSSSQHLIRELLPQYPTLWVNTVGMRRPNLSMRDFRRALSWIKNKFMPEYGKYNGPLGGLKAWRNPNGLTVIRPLMYPGFRKPWQRRVNARLIAKAVRAKLLPNHRHVVITALPIAADLPDLIRAERWLYYCVDDFSKWPGTDQHVMNQMEIDLLSRVSTVCTVSDTLSDRMRMLGASNPLMITHGIHEDIWRIKPGAWAEIRDPNNETDFPHWRRIEPAITKEWNKKIIALFWGLIDQRLDIDWLRTLKQSGCIDKTVLVGPSDAPPAGLSEVAECPGEFAWFDLAPLAEKASVLIMPYIDAPVTRAMQPLKLKEYLATMKPVVVRDLPSTREWADCCDLASDAKSFANLVVERAKTGTPPSQLEARRRRLPGESWTAKAAQLAAIINAG